MLSNLQPITEWYSYKPANHSICYLYDPIFVQTSNQSRNSTNSNQPITIKEVYMTQYTQQQTRTMFSDLVTRVTVHCTTHTSINCSLFYSTTGHTRSQMEMFCGEHQCFTCYTREAQKSHVHLSQVLADTTKNQTKSFEHIATTTFINKWQHKKAQKLKPSPNVTTNEVQFWLIYTKFNKRQSAKPVLGQQTH